MDYYNLKTVKSGDTTKKVRFEMLGGAGPIDLTGADIKMQLRPYGDRNFVAKTLQAPTASGITIADAPAGIFELEPYTADMAPGRYVYDIQFTFPAGTVRTYFGGEQKIKHDITQ